MAEMEEIRLEALQGITVLAIHDDQFRRAVMDDLEGTLRRYGYELTDQEMERLRRAQRDIAGWSDEDLARFLREREPRVLTEEEERILSPEQFLRRRWRF
jgi:ribosome-binding protein aMBF1 (putative translation factor)